MMSKPAVPPSNAGFVHLHVHSAYSLLKGSIKIAKLAELAKADRQPALALTDTDNMFGALKFSDKMAGYGIQPIIGCELAVDFGDQDPSARNALAAAPARIVLLAARERGYRSLMRLNSRAFLETPIHQTPHIKFEWLQGDAEDLIALTGGPEGPISLAIHADLTSLCELGWNEIVVDGRANAYINAAGFDLMAGADFVPGTIAVVTADGSARQVATALPFPTAWR